MALSTQVLEGLEIFENNYNHSERGSLFDLIDRTRTKMGYRLLRQWLARPLIDHQAIRDRQSCVLLIKELMHGPFEKFKRIEEALNEQIPDLQRILTRIHYLRCSAKDLCRLLSVTLVLVDYAIAASHELQKYNGASLNAKPHITHLLSCIANAKEVTRFAISDIHPQWSTNAKSLVSFFQTPTAQMQQHMFKKEQITNALQTHLNDLLSSTLSHIDYVKDYVVCGDTSYLIQLKNEDLDSVPESWIKMNGTKQVSRFHTPFIRQLIPEMEECQEQLENASKLAFVQFQKAIGQHYFLFHDCFAAVAELDCLMALARLCPDPGLVMPMTCDTMTMSLVQSRHPMIDALEKEQGRLGAIPNDIFMSPDTKSMLITGPNMGGKSSLVKQIALLSILHQIGSPIPAHSAVMPVFDSIFILSGASDAILKGQSTFMKELTTTKHIMDQATCHSLVILDELGRGTCTIDGTAIAYAVLKHFITDIGAMTLFVSHYPFLTTLQNELSYPEQLRIYHMGYIELPAENRFSSRPTIVFTHKLEPGLCTVSHALHVASMADIPGSIIDHAKNIISN